MHVRQVFAHTAHRLRAVERQVVVAATWTAVHHARQLDGPLARDRVEVCLVLIVSVQT